MNPQMPSVSETPSSLPQLSQFRRRLDDEIMSHLQNADRPYNIVRLVTREPLGVISNEVHRRYIVTFSLGPNFDLAKHGEMVMKDMEEFLNARDCELTTSSLVNGDWVAVVHLKLQTGNN